MITLRQTFFNGAILAIIMVKYTMIESVAIYNNTASLPNITDNHNTVNFTEEPISDTVETTHRPSSSTPSVKHGHPSLQSTTRSIWVDYDQEGAKNFIITTVVVYCLVGALTLLLLRMCRRAQRIHKDTDRSDERVCEYLRVSRDLQDQGDRYRLLCQKNRICRALDSIEEQKSINSSNSNSNSNIAKGDSTSLEVTGDNDVFLSPEQSRQSVTATTASNKTTKLIAGGCLHHINSDNTSSVKLENDCDGEIHLLAISENKPDGVS